MQKIEKAFAAGANAFPVKPNDFDKPASTVIRLAEKPVSMGVAA